MKFCQMNCQNRIKPRICMRGISWLLIARERKKARKNLNIRGEKKQRKGNNMKFLGERKNEKTPNKVDHNEDIEHRKTGISLSQMKWGTANIEVNKVMKIWSSKWRYDKMLDIRVEMKLSFTKTFECQAISKLNIYSYQCINKVIFTMNLIGIIIGKPFSRLF